MNIKSLDPRITRAEIPAETADPMQPLPPLDQLETYEVFHQEKRGEHVMHVGSLHAPNPEIALVLAKEQYARRSRCVSLWVARTADIHMIPTEDADIFETTPDKDYRGAGGYRVGTKLTKIKRQQGAGNE